MNKSFNTFDPQRCANRWLCYFDILGFKRLVMREGSDCESLVTAVHTYYQSREIVEQWVRRNSRLGLVCWSDSYVLYSSDDSEPSFWQIEQAARWIINEHLMRHIPIRGALACGSVYAV